MADISYTPTTWADGAEGGTPIDAAKLNNIESGIVDAVAAIGPNDTTADGTLKAQIDANAAAVALIPGLHVYSQYTFPRNIPTGVLICRIISIGSVSSEDAYLLCIDSTGKAYSAINEKNASTVTWNRLAFA